MQILATITQVQPIDVLFAVPQDRVPAVRQAQARGLSISMTEENHCYENAKAERVNEILKQEYGLGGCFRTKAQALAAVAEAVKLYNTRRPHQALKYKTPEEVHQRAA